MGYAQGKKQERRVLGYELREVDWSQITKALQTTYGGHGNVPLRFFAEELFFSDSLSYCLSVSTAEFAGELCYLPMTEMIGYLLSPLSGDVGLL